MKRFLLFLLPLVIAGIAFGVFLFFLTQNGINKGALQVTTTPKSKVYLNGVLIGETPVCKCDINSMLPIGDYTLRLVPLKTDQEAFEQKITLGKAVLTVVDRSFTGNTTSEGSVISLQKLSSDSDSELFFTSFPDQTSILLDQSLIGQTPLVLKNITPGDHDVSFQKNGYKEKSIKIHSVKGYRLSAITFLGIDLASSLGLPVPATVSAVPVGVTPTPSPLLTPKVGKQVVILDTPTGFLRVRSIPSLAGSSSAQVKPGDTYEMLDQKNGWTQISLSQNQTGWVSSQYIKPQ